MSDISAFHFPYHGFSVPNGIPFYPKIKEVGGAKKVSFNQGYVFDFTSARGNKGVRKIKVEKCDTEYEAADKHFHLEIKTSKDIANVLSAEVKEGEASSTETEHYSAKNIGDEGVYSNGEGVFKIPICQLDSEGNIIEWNLRENIQWQKINFENAPKEPDSKQSIGVLYNWGDEDKFNDNPTVKFSNLVQLEEEKEQIIELKRSESKKNIVITTQIPPAPKDKMSVLYRNSENKFIWLQADENYTQILYQQGAEMRFFDAPETAAEGIQLLGSEGNGLLWATYSEIDIDVCQGNASSTITVLTKIEPA
jgi:hypothetical protein